MPSKTFLDLGKIGVVKDVASQELPINAWSDAMNMRFRNGGIERMKGEQQVFATPTVTPPW